MKLASRPTSTASFPKVAFALLFSTMLAWSPSLVAAVPRGVFSLSPAGSACKEAVLSNPSVDGVSIRQDWKDLEPSEGVFDWSFLDSEVARIGAAGKKVLLRINTQAAKPAWVTSAVNQAGGTFFTFDDGGVQTTIPVFWDPTFLAQKKAMIAALGSHFTDNPAITIVWASFANASSEDWSVPHTASEAQEWLAVGYTSAKLIDAGKQIIDATMAAFPKQYVTLAVAGDGNLDPDPNYVARNAILAARATWPGRLIVQKNNLATFNPPAPGTGTVFQLLWDSRPEVAGQMLFNCFTDQTYRVNNGAPGDAAAILHQSVNAGAAYGMNYIEIYQVDVLNIPTEITYAHNLLLGLVPPINPPKAPTGVKMQP
ncbi:MAG: beta-galactosidase [Chthoniobacterales bacterium]